MGANPPTPASRRPGRPRSEQVTAAILHAASELLAEEGLLAMTLDAVAARAGTSRATIYRWWDSKESLALDTFEVGFEDQVGWASMDTGSLAGDLHAILEARMRVLTVPGALRLFAALLAQAHADPVFGTVCRERVFMPLRDSAREIFERAMARGEIPAGTDLDLAIDLLIGPMNNRLLHGCATIDATFVSSIARCVVIGLVAGEEKTRRSESEEFDNT
jgi:AcrR family transcriptional regulator